LFAGQLGYPDAPCNGKADSYEGYRVAACQGNRQTTLVRPGDWQTLSTGFGYCKTTPVAVSAAGPQSLSGGVTETAHDPRLDGTLCTPLSDNPKAEIIA